MKKRESLCTVGGIVNWCSDNRTVWRFLKNLDTELPYDPAISLLHIYLKKTRTLIQKDICTPKLLQLFYNSQDMEAIQVSIDRWMGKEEGCICLVCVCVCVCVCISCRWNGILLVIKNWKSWHYDNMNGSRGYYA